VWANDDARKAAVFFRTMDTAGLPIFQSLITRSLSNGVPIWGSVRMGEWYPPVAGQTYYPFNGDVWSNHPEWRIKNRSGSYGTKMSLANGEIQQMIIGTLEKMVRMGCDGINLDFCRYPEVLGYETPLINGFMQQYPGVDPRILSSIDPRWIAYRCGVINGFISDVRTAMTAAGGSRTIKISVRLPATDFQSYGFEPQTWITNGWVDILIPHYPGNERDFDIQPWLDMIPNPNPNNIKIYPGITSDKKIIGETELTDAEIAAGVPLGTVIRMTDDDYRRKARQRNAADGVYIFNNWKGTGCLNLIGDKQYLKRWSYFEDPYNQPRVNATP